MQGFLSSRRIRLVVGSVVAATSITVLGVGVGPASAAQTVSKVQLDGSTVYFFNEGSTANNLQVDLPSATQLRIRESAPGLTLRLSGGCTLSEENRVATCPWATGNKLSISLTSTAGGGATTTTITGDIQVEYYGSDGPDTYQGGSAKDLVQSGNGNDIVNGGGGDDELFGGDGDDVLDGQDGGDNLIGGKGEDRMRGGAGIDRVRYLTIVTNRDAAGKATYGNDDWEWRTIGVTANLNGKADDGSSEDDDGDPSDGLEGDWIESGVEGFSGTEFNDTLVGDDGPNVLSGFGGDDTLIGNKGDDTFRGHAGNDTIRADDGEKDSDISCNNSDSSRGTNPNTIYYDEGLDPVTAANSFADCSERFPQKSGSSSPTTTAPAGGSGSTNTTTPAAGAPSGGTSSGSTLGNRTVVEVQEDKGLVKSVAGAPSLELTPYLVPSSPDEGDTITVFPGKWSVAKPNYDYEWRSCEADDVEQVKCSVRRRGDFETYRVTRKDVGRIIVVSVIAEVGGKKATALTLPTAVVDARMNVTIPRSAVPTLSGGKLTQRRLDSLQAELAKYVDGGVVDITYVPTPLKRVPKAWRRLITDNSVYAITPEAGSTVVGKGSKPVKINVRYYDKALDFAACPDKDIAAWNTAVTGTPLPVAIDMLVKKGCDWRVEWTTTAAKTPYMQVLGASMGEDPDDDVETTSIILRVSQPAIDEFALLIGAPLLDQRADTAGMATMTTSLDMVALPNQAKSRLWASLQWLSAGIGRAGATFQLFDVNGRMVAEKKASETSDTVLDYAFTRAGVARIVATVDENTAADKTARGGQADYRQVYLDFDVAVGGPKVLLDGRCVERTGEITERCGGVPNLYAADNIRTKLENEKLVTKGKFSFAADAMRDAYKNRGISYKIQAANRKLTEDLVSSRSVRGVTASKSPDGEAIVRKNACFFLDILCQLNLVKGWIEQIGRPAQKERRGSARPDTVSGVGTVAQIKPDTVLGGLAGGNCIQFTPEAHQCWSVARKSPKRELTLADVLTPKARFALGPNELVRMANLKKLTAAQQTEVVNLISAGGQNLISAGGMNLISAGGMNLISAGGMNLTISGKSLGEIASLIANEGMAVPKMSTPNLVKLALLIGLDGATLIGLDGATLIGLDGATLIGLDGATLIGLDGATLIGLDGATLTKAVGSNLISAGGQNLISAGGMNFSADSVLSIARLIGLDGSTLIGLDGATATSVASGALKDMSQATMASLSMAVAQQGDSGSINSLMLGAFKAG